LFAKTGEASLRLLLVSFVILLLDLRFFGVFCPAIGRLFRDAVGVLVAVRDRDSLWLILGVRVWSLIRDLIIKVHHF